MVPIRYQENIVSLRFYVWLNVYLTIMKKYIYKYIFYYWPTLHSHLFRYRSIFCDGIIGERSKAKSLFNCRLRIAHHSAKGGCFRCIIVPNRWNRILASSLFFLNYFHKCIIFIRYIVVYYNVWRRGNVFELRETTKIPLTISRMKGRTIPWFGYAKRREETN